MERLSIDQIDVSGPWLDVLLFGDWGPLEQYAAWLQIVPVDDAEFLVARKNGVAVLVGLLDGDQLEDRSVVTISWSVVPTVYVQLEQSATETVALTGADGVLGPDRSLGPSDRLLLEAAGWAAPEVDPTGRRTWRTSVPWPVRSAEYEQLALRCVNVLRLVHGVPKPEELEYRAWRDAEPPPEHELYYEEALEPAEPYLSLPRLGLRDAPRS